MSCPNMVLAVKKQSMIVFDVSVSGRIEGMFHFHLSGISFYLLR